MKRFDAIEGLRGWLALAVVFAHVQALTNVTLWGFGPVIAAAGHVAVLVFIIVSGFVITHLVIERPEPYAPYLVRRFMRIFPLFALTCAVGYFTVDLLGASIVGLPWPPNADAAALILVAADDHRNLWPHALAHLTMLHGLIGNNLLPNAAYAFNPPGWSLSLEWQFYLVAPLLIGLLRRPRPPLILAAALVFGAAAYQVGWLGSFGNPSIFFGAAGFFVVGIASRLMLPGMTGRVPQPDLVLITAAVLAPWSVDLAPFLLWAAMLTWLATDRARIALPIARALCAMLESDAARWLGARSYSVYLCHMSAAALILTGWRELAVLPGRDAVFVVLIVAVPVATVVAAAALYRLIERPGIRLGTVIAAVLGRGARDAISLPAE